MPKFYFQIKARIDNKCSSEWQWPPHFSGMVDAENKKSALIKINEDYDREFKQRIKVEDRNNHGYLLHIDEIKDDHHRRLELFDLKVCKHCEQNFRIIDKYNDPNEIDKGRDFCSHQCKEIDRAENREDRMGDYLGNAAPIIYKITNKHTGLCYIGQTTQPFTLRWYQHFFFAGKCKFHQAIKESKVTDWIFEVIEEIAKQTGIDHNLMLAERERFWIDHYDSVNSGYNTVLVKKK